MNEGIIEYIKRFGSKRNYKINDTFSANNSFKCWYIEKGNVELNYVKILKGKPEGKLYNFIILRQGSIFFGINNDIHPEIILLTTIKENAIIYEFSISNLINYTSTVSEIDKKLIPLMDNWINKLIETVDNKKVKKSDDVEYVNIIKGKKYDIEKNKVVSTKGKSIWISTSDFSKITFFNQKINKQVSTDLFYIPLNDKISIKTKGKIQLESYDLKTCIRNDNFWKSLRSFYLIIFDIFYVELKKTYKEDKRILEAKYKQADFEFISTLNIAKKVLNETGKTFHDSLFSEYDDEFFKICSIIANYNNINLVCPSEVKNSKDPLADICRYSKIRYREIVLEDYWYKKEGIYSILGYIQETGEPIAIIPNKKKYIVYRNNEAESFEVNDENYQILSRWGYMFYRPFPEEKFSIKKLINFSLGKEKSDFLKLGIITLIITLLGLFVPILTAVLFDYIIPNAVRSQLVFIGAALIVAALGKIMFEVTKNFTLLRIEGKMDSSLQPALWDKLLNLSTRFFKKFTAGDLAVRSLGISYIRKIISGLVITSFLGGVFSLINFFLMFYYSAKLASISLLFVLLLFIVMVFLAKRIIKSTNQQLEYHGITSGIVLQLFSGINTFRASGTEIRAFTYWFKKFIPMKKAAIDVANFQNVQRIINSTAQLLSMLIIYFSIIKFSNILTTGQFLAFYAAFGAFISAMIELSNNMLPAFQVTSIYKRLKPILDENPENDSTKIAPKKLEGNIELSNIKFSYSPQGPLILDDISLKIKDGEFVALVGPSGSGKSTIIRLLLGFENPKSGTIIYDNQDLSTIDPKLLRNQIGVVLQDGGLMDDDIISNINGASPKFTMNDAWEAAKAAGLDEDIMNMPMGMYTVLMDNGATLSGGQRQRLMIARALVHKPKILIFDEATSALDNRTQAIVTESLRKLNVTRIVVAHRLSTIIDADKIYFLEKGKIIESGTYKELMAMKGEFAKLAQRQIE